MNNIELKRFGPGTCKYCGYPAPEGCYLCDQCAREEADRESQEDSDE